MRQGILQCPNKELELHIHTVIESKGVVAKRKWYLPRLAVSFPESTHNGIDKCTGLIEEPKVVCHNEAVFKIHPLFPPPGMEDHNIKKIAPVFAEEASWTC